MDIRIGVPIHAEDGGAGRVHRIILHPETRALSAIVAVDDDGLQHEVLIPAGSVISADEKCVRVRGTVEEVLDGEAFASAQYVSPPEEWIPRTAAAEDAAHYLIPASPYAVGAFERPAPQPAPAEREIEDLEGDDVEISGGTSVHCTDGVAGRIDRVITEGDTDRVTHLVVQRGQMLSRELLVPVGHVALMDGSGVHLDLSQDDLDHLPTFDEE